MLLLQLSEATSTASKAAGNVTSLASNDPLFSLLWFLVITLGICVAALVIFTIKSSLSQADKLSAATLLIVTPMKEAHEKILLERNEKHAQEIRANETNHQAQQLALHDQLKSEREDRRKLTETAQNVYKEMAEIVSPFTKSNELLAQRVHDVELLLRQSIKRPIRFEDDRPSA